MVCVYMRAHSFMHPHLLPSGTKSELNPPSVFVQMEAAYAKCAVQTTKSTRKCRIEVDPAAGNPSEVAAEEGKIYIKRQQQQ